MSDELVIRHADRRDLDEIETITRACYEKYVTRLGYQPLPMTADHGTYINEEAVWILERARKSIG